MSLAETQSIDIGAGAVSLPRVSVGPGQTSIYTSADGNVSLTVSHANKSRTRRVARVDVRKTAADPLFSAQNVVSKMAGYLVIDVPVVGFTAAEAKSMCTGLMTLLTASTNANLIKVTQGES